MKYHAPPSVEAAAALLAGASEARIIAGGMSLVPVMKHGLAAPSDLVDLGRIAGLAGITFARDGVVIGAMTRHATVASELAARLPSVARLAAGIGDPQVRHRGTIGGSIANNDPAADYPAACLAIGTSIVTSRREIAPADFFTGFFSTALAPAEIVTAVHFAIPERAAYAKFANQASRFALTGVFVAQIAGAVRVAVAGAGAQGVFRAHAIETALARRFAPEAIEPGMVSPVGLIADLHASAAYRAQLIVAMARRAVADCLGIAHRRPLRHGGALAYE